MTVFDALKPWALLGDYLSQIPKIFREVAWLVLTRAKQVPQ